MNPQQRRCVRGSGTLHGTDFRTGPLQPEFDSGFALAMPIILKRPQDALHSLVYKLQNIRLPYLLRWRCSLRRRASQRVGLIPHNLAQHDPKGTRD